jgi:hypothetical protein
MPQVALVSIKTSTMKTLLTIILVFVIFPAIGQNAFSISGTVTDSTTKDILVNASVSLRGVGTTAKRLVVTDEKGCFIIDQLKEDKYIVEVAYIGFIQLKQTILLQKNEIIAISLQKATGDLANVTVTSGKKIITHNSDKIVLDVKESAVSASDNLYNIILKVPGVSESNGSLYYQGKPVSILLDSKSNNLSGEDLKSWLSGMLGTHTDKLEILLNPSAKYDAQGGVVINIKSQRNKNYGTTRSVTLGIGSGTYLRSPLGFSLNYRDSTINIYGGYDYNYIKQYFHLDALFDFNNDPSVIDLSDHNIRAQDNHAIRFGIDHDLDKRTSAGLLFRAAKNFRRRKIFDRSVVHSGTSAPDTVVTVNILTDASYFIPSLNVYFKRKLSAKGAELVVNADYWSLSRQWTDNIDGWYSDIMSNPISNYYLNNSSPTKNSVRSITADYAVPINKWNMEAGIKSSESRTDNNVLWERLLNNEWKTDSSKSNHFIYKENVHAAYINLTTTYSKWNIQAGLRAEFTRSVGNSLTLKMITERKYSDLFPSVNIQYRPSAKHLVSLTYKQSIKRFGFDIINPFINLQGQYSYHKGNPYIRPSYFKSFGINWSYKNSLVVSGSFSLVKDPISYAYEKGPDNTSHGTYLNFSSGRLLNGSVNYTAKLLRSKGISINAVNFSHTELPDFNGYIQHTNNYAISSTNTIALPSKFTLEVSGLYNSSLLDGTVWQSEYYGMSAGIAKQLFGAKGSLKLSCTDIFDTQVLHFKTKGNGINISSEWKVESRFINLLFTYRFGNLNIKANKSRKTGIEDEKARMGNN